MCMGCHVDVGARVCVLGELYGFSCVRVRVGVCMGVGVPCHVCVWVPCPNTLSCRPGPGRGFCAM